MVDATHHRRREKILLPGMVPQYSRNGLSPLHNLFMNTKEAPVFRPGDDAVEKFANALEEDPEKAMRLCLWFGDNNARCERSNMNPIMPASLKRNGFTDEEREMIKGGPLKRKVYYALCCYSWDNHPGLILDNLEILARNASLKELLKLLTYAVYGKGMHERVDNPAFPGSVVDGMNREARKKELCGMQRHQSQATRRLESCIAFLKEEYGDDNDNWEEQKAIFRRRANYPTLFSMSEDEAKEACKNELMQIRDLHSQYKGLIEKLDIYLTPLEHGKVFNAYENWEGDEDWKDIVSRSLHRDNSGLRVDADETDFVDRCSDFFQQINDFHAERSALKKKSIFFQMPVWDIRSDIFSDDEARLKEICDERYQMFMGNTKLADLLMLRPFPRRQKGGVQDPGDEHSGDEHPGGEDKGKKNQVCYVLRPIPGAELTHKYHAWIEERQRKQKKEAVRRRRDMREERLEWMAAALKDPNVEELFDRVADIFATLIKVDLDKSEHGKPFGGLAAKWAPTPGNRDDNLLPGEAGIVSRIRYKLGPHRYEDALKRLRTGWPETLNLNDPKVDVRRLRWTSKNLDRCLEQSAKRRAAKEKLEAMINEKSIKRAEVKAQIEAALAAGKDTEAFQKLLDKYSPKVTGIMPHQVVEKAATGERANSPLLNMQWAKIREDVTAGRSGDDVCFIVPMVDVSPSMGGNNAIYPAIAIGLLLAACPGPAEGLMITFSEKPQMVNIDEMIRKAGDVPELGQPGHLEKVVGLIMGLEWGNCTNFVDAYKLAMAHAKQEGVPRHVMETSKVVVLTDMELNQNDIHSDPFETSYDRIREISKDFGYDGAEPGLVFWDLSENAQKTMVAPPDAPHVTNLSGFSASLVNLVLAGCSVKELEKEKDFIRKGGATEKLIQDSVYNNPAYDGLDIKSFCPRFTPVE